MYSGQNENSRNSTRLSAIVKDTQKTCLILSENVNGHKRNKDVLLVQQREYELARKSNIKYSEQQKKT